MHRRTKILSVLMLFCMSFASPAQALTMAPPEPFDCRLADKAQSAEIKVNLYTLCLTTADPSGIRLRDWQRHDVHFRRANALFELRRYPEALADYNLFISQSGGHVWALHQRGLTYQALGQREKAVADFDKALTLNPDAIDVRHDRGQLLARMGKYQAAIEDLRKTVALVPDWAGGLNELAWMLATCPDARFQDGTEAVRLARKAVGIERSANHLDTLAAANARAGDFMQAATIQKEALELLQQKKAPMGTLKELEARLDLYSSGHAYQENRPM